MSARWRAAGLLPVLVFALAATVPAAAEEKASVQPGSMAGGTVVKSGWWWAVNDTPDQTLAAPPQPSPPNVPAGALPVSAVGGEPDKLSALELALDAEPGAFAESVHLALREVAQPGSNLNSAAAKVVACPITDVFWADGEAAAWKARPTYDCGTGVPGERDENGVWRFDLTSLAASWLSADAAQPASVVLVEDVEAPESFQVVFDGIAAEGIGLAAVSTAAPAAGEKAPSTGSGSVAAGGGGSSGDLPTSGATASESGAGVLSDSGARSAALDPAISAPMTEASTDTAGVSAPEAAVAAPVAAVTGPMPWYSGMPRAAFALFPFALGLAYLAMLALGPDAQPVTVSSRHGVSRALEKLRRIGAQAVTGGAGR